MREVFLSSKHDKIVEELLAPNINRIDVAFVIKNTSNNILLCKRSKQKKLLPNTWHIPGGKLEFGETASQALKRELKEELNLILTDITHFYTDPYEYKIDYNSTANTYYYEINCSGNIQLNNENSDYGYFDRAGLLKINQNVANLDFLIENIFF